MSARGGSGNAGNGLKTFAMHSGDGGEGATASAINAELEGASSAPRASATAAWVWNSPPGTLFRNDEPATKAQKLGAVATAFDDVGITA